MRSDSVLNTGLSSASINKASKERAARAERQKLRDEKRTTLLPAVQILVDELLKEQEKTKLSLLKIIGPATPADDVKSLLVSLNLYDQSMTTLRTRISNIMRTKVVEDE